MYAQRQTNASRPSAGRRTFQTPPVIRARIGLLMRKGSNFGEMEDAERTMRNAGLGLAPVSPGNQALNDGGMTVLATAEMADFDRGVLRGLMIPEGSDDLSEAAVAAARAIGAGLPVIAFGSSIAAVAAIVGVEPVEGTAAVFDQLGVRSISDNRSLTSAASSIS